MDIKTDDLLNILCWFLLYEMEGDNNVPYMAS